MDKQTLADMVNLEWSKLYSRKSSSADLTKTIMREFLYKRISGLFYPVFSKHDSTNIPYSNPAKRLFEALYGLYHDPEDRYSYYSRHREDTYDNLPPEHLLETPRGLRSFRICMSEAVESSATSH